MQKIIYQDPATKTQISEIVFFRDTIWMTQGQIWELYWKAWNTISEHIKKIYKDWELEEDKTCVNERIFGNTENTSRNSFKKPKKYYNLRSQSLKKVFNEDELRKLYLLSEQFFAFAELQYAYERDLTMEDWNNYLDELLKMNQLEILEWKWNVSREKAEEFVKHQMALYQKKWWSLEAHIEWANYLLEKWK